MSHSSTLLPCCVLLIIAQPSVELRPDLERSPKHLQQPFGSEAFANGHPVSSGVRKQLETAIGSDAGFERIGFLSGRRVGGRVARIFLQKARRFSFKWARGALFMLYFIMYVFLN